MVFRRDGNKVDSFQRQMNALRQQIGDEEESEAFEDERDAYAREGGRERPGRTPGDSGYSFGSFPSATSGQADAFDEGGAPVVPEMPQADQQVSVIAAGTSWKGDLNAEGSLHVYGRASGTLKASEDVWIADGAEVDAQIDANRVVVAGDVTGQITAHARFEALPNCDIQADVDAPTFVVHEGATLNGALTMKSAGSALDIESRESRNRPGSIIQRRARTSS